VPVSSKGRLAGFIGFESRRAEKPWLEQDVVLIKMAGEIFITALEHKRTEEALQSNERELRQITDTMLDAVYRADANGIIEFASPSCWHVFGYPPESLLRTSVYQHIHPDDIEAMRAGMFNTGSAEHRYQHANGNTIWLETLSNLIFTEDGQIEGIVLASRDITQRRRAQHELQELNRLKTEFLSTAAHELRTPLTTIRGFSEILLSRRLEADRQLRFLTMINEQATHLGKIIDDLLDISRLEAKRNLTLVMDPVDMGELIERTIRPFQEAATHHHFVLERCANCPPILGDAVRLTQVIENLLSNARKYSPEGGTVLVRVSASDEMVRVSVQDEGIGLTPDEMEHLFEKFYRANASNTAVNGTGLGLAISKLIVELHGGTIWADSKPGKGSTFSFTLPLMMPSLKPDEEPVPYVMETRA
jgi:PAS domain S-box-containing protein